MMRRKDEALCKEIRSEGGKKSYAGNAEDEDDINHTDIKLISRTASTCLTRSQSKRKPKQRFLLSELDSLD